MSSSSSTDKILYLLKTRGELTAKTLAEQLDMTSMGARQHLLSLQKQELVESFHKAEKVGRPSQYWQLASAAYARFPDSHSQLTMVMLDGVKQLFGEQGLEQLIQHRESAMQQDYLQRLADKPQLVDKLQELVNIRNQEGYMASCELDPAGFYWFYENHCPICDAASQCQNFCRSELKLFQDCFAELAEVERQEHILDGARRCSYKVSPYTNSTK